MFQLQSHVHMIMFHYTKSGSLCDCMEPTCKVTSHEQRCMALMLCSVKYGCCQPKTLKEWPSRQDTLLSTEALEFLLPILTILSVVDTPDIIAPII